MKQIEKPSAMTNTLYNLYLFRRRPIPVPDPGKKMKENHIESSIKKRRIRAENQQTVLSKKQSDVSNGETTGKQQKRSETQQIISKEGKCKDTEIKRLVQLDFSSLNPSELRKSTKTLDELSLEAESIKTAFSVIEAKLSNVKCSSVCDRQALVKMKEEVQAIERNYRRTSDRLNELISKHEHVYIRLMKAKLSTLQCLDVSKMVKMREFEMRYRCTSSKLDNLIFKDEQVLTLILDIKTDIKYVHH